MTEIKEYTNESLEEFLKSYKTIDSEFIRILNLFEKSILNLNEISKFNIYLNLSNAWGLNKDDCREGLVTALTYAKEAEHYINGLPYGMKKDFYFVKSHIYARMENYNESKESYVKHIYFNSCCEIFPQLPAGTFKKVNGFSKIPLYSFRPINKYSISDLIKGQITLADPVTFNDPFDTPLFSYIELHRRKIKDKSKYDIKPMVDAYRHIKIRCFVKHNIKKRKQPFEDQLMWSHYADSHKGICIRYKFDPEINLEDKELLTFSNWYDVRYLHKIKIEDPKSVELRSLLATKNKCWEYENEVRLIDFDPTCPDKYKQISIKKSKIEAIFFGCRCPREDIIMVKKIFPKTTDIKFFEFKFNPEGIWNDTYKLEPKDKKKFIQLG